jgi:beta-lactamase superfamily II metal-dependent hydrolase
LPETIDIISTIYTTKDYNYVESAFIGGSGYYNAGGDCTLFQTPNAKNVIIDFSNLGPMSGAVKKALYYRGVFRVDAAVVSHYHSDHTQGLCYALVNKVLDFTHCTFYLPDDTSMQYVIDNMGEGERFYGDYDTSSHETYVLINSYFDAEPDQEGNVTLTWNGSTYTVPQFQGTVVYPDHDGQTAIIDGLEIVFWNTDHSVYTSSGNGTYNEFSLCCDVLFGQKRICMAGDIGPVGEEQIQNHMKKANILKAQHHGWENSVMNSDFICRVYPEIVVTEDSSEHDMLIYRETSPLQSWCEKNGVPNYRTRTNGVMDFVITDKSISATSVMKNFVRGGIDWCLTYGDSANRPKSCRPGMQYFDTTIGKPIYWCVNDNHPSGAWVDSTGEAV